MIDTEFLRTRKERMAHMDNKQNIAAIIQIIIVDIKLRIEF